MAEAVIVIDDDDEPQPERRPDGGPTPTGSRYFCHFCKNQLDAVMHDFTCPMCTSGFVEELTEPSGPADPNDVDMHDDEEEALFPFLPAAMNTRLSNEISSLLMSVTGGQYPEMDGVALSPDEAQLLAGVNGEPRTAQRRQANEPPAYIRTTSGPSRGGRRRARTQSFHFADFDNIVQEFLVNVTGRGGAPGQHGPMYFMGNPEDYVYGREGLDTIVTQLLNQMDGTGPPPLNKDRIAEIPKVAVTKEQVDEKLQCSICWEDFVLDETVRKLPCVHIYHEMCIVPWLELHGTCPVCRQALNADDSDDGHQQRASDAVTNSLRNVAALYRDGNNHIINIVPGRTPNSAIASTSRRPQSARRGARRHHYSGRPTERAQSPGERRDEDGNVDYDFD